MAGNLLAYDTLPRDAPSLGGSTVYMRLTWSPGSLACPVSVHTRPVNAFRVSQRDIAKVPDDPLTLRHWFPMSHSGVRYFRLWLRSKGALIDV